MYILASNIWFTKLMKQFFFLLDKIVFNFISIIYDVMISIARISVLTQADIAEMSDRIYKLLAIFMIFKVTLSLITYVVNPDDFSDKSKGVSKLGINIIISMALLILTPYIFSYAYQFQTIILEDNALGTLVFGGDNDKESFFNTAGDKIAYTVMKPFFTPNTAINGLNSCSILILEKDGDEKVFNPDCSGLNEDLTPRDNTENTLYSLTEKNETFGTKDLINYVVGVESESLGLMFREEMAVATYKSDTGETEFIMDYKFIFSTVTGVIIILLLITFCMDIAVRSIKLAFLQLVAPIPIISYVDPKSGKDGLFKKWYEMCFKTFLSLFIRLIALYFAVFVISKVADLRLVDVVDGSYVIDGIISVFIIIGALMFAKQLPKMLEGLGIKLDGDGKFFLNPLKKIEEGAIGGKQIGKAAKLAARPVKGLATAGLVGGAAAITGQGFRGGLSAFKGAMKGEKFGKNFSASYSAARTRKKQVDEMKANGIDPWDVRKENLYNFFHGTTKAEKVQQVADKSKAIQSSYEAMKNQAVACDAYDEKDSSGRVIKKSAKTISKELDELNKTQIDRNSFKDIVGKTAQEQYDEALAMKNSHISELTTKKAQYQSRISDINLESTKLKTEKANLNRSDFSSDDEYYEAHAAYQQKLAVLDQEKQSYDLNEIDAKIAETESERNSLSVDSFDDQESITAEEQYMAAISEQKQRKADMEKELENRINDLANGKVKARDTKGEVVESAMQIIKEAKDDMIALTNTVNKIGEELSDEFKGIAVEQKADGSFDVVTAMKQSKGTAGVTSVGTMADITTKAKYTKNKKS